MIKVIMHPGPLQELVARHMLELLQQQCVALCWKKQMSSVLRVLQPQDLIKFSFGQLVDEWASIAPLLLKVLATVAHVEHYDPASNVAGICTAGAVLVRQRNVHMSALHHLAGLILFHENASKLVGQQYSIT